MLAWNTYESASINCGVSMSEEQPKSGFTKHLILRAASKIFGQRGFRDTSVENVAKEAGMSEDEVQHHFHTKETLLLEAQKATFRELHRRIAERSKRGERGIGSALSALDSMWTSIRDLREGAPFVVETLSLSGKKGPLRKQLRSFYQESTALLSDGIRLVFVDDVNTLPIPPDRLAVLLRILLEGLMVELAQVQNRSDLVEIDQAYSDFRKLFKDYIINSHPIEDPNAPFPLDDETAEVPLPW